MATEPSDDALPSAPTDTSYGTPSEPGPGSDDTVGRTEAREPGGTATATGDMTGAPPARPAAAPEASGGDGGSGDGGSGDAGGGGGTGQGGKKSRTKAWFIEWAVILVVVVGFAFLLRTFVVQTFYIPSGSMIPTLQVGDRILVDKLSYHLHGVHRGDVVVFSKPPLEHQDINDLVKRVIGLPGETISSVDNRVYINGKPLKEPWLQPNVPTLPSPVQAPFNLSHPYKIPQGMYFVMGDNRTDSEDSRWFGPISGNLIVGRAFVIVWPLSRIGGI